MIKAVEKMERKCYVKLSKRKNNKDFMSLSSVSVLVLPLTS